MYYYLVSTFGHFGLLGLIRGIEAPSFYVRFLSHNFLSSVNGFACAALCVCDVRHCLIT